MKTVTRHVQFRHQTRQTMWWIVTVPGQEQISRKDHMLFTLAAQMNLVTSLDPWFIHGE